MKPRYFFIKSCAYSINKNSLPLNRHSLPGPDDIERIELPNEIILLIRQNFSSPSIVINGFVTAGSLADPDEKLGLADFVSSALMRGTQKDTFKQIYDRLESVGASLGFETGVHATNFWGRALVEDFDLLLELLSDTIRQAVFPPEQIERLRTQLISNLAIRDQSTADMASILFDQIVYANHPYSRPEDGFQETIRLISRDDLVAFHQQNYGSKGMTIAIVGAIETQEIIERIERYFGDWENPFQKKPSDLPPIFPLDAITKKRVYIPGKVQIDILLGTAGPPRTSSDFIPASLGNSILGQFGMMGRIGASLREEAGLAYYAQSSLAGGIGPGPWVVSAGVAPENVEKAIDLIQREISRFVTEPVSIEELSDSQTNFIGRLPLSLESNSGVAAALINLERYHLGLDYYLRFHDLVKAVTPQQILLTAQRYLKPASLAIAIAGPSNEMQLGK